MFKTSITIDPKDFTASQWVEAYYAGTALTQDRHHKAGKVKRTREQVEELARCCRSKAKNLPPGGSRSENAEWRASLTGAAQVLEGYLK